MSVLAPIQKLPLPFIAQAMRFVRTLSGVSLIILVAGCSSAYYSALEKVGIHKRDVLVDRVEEVTEAQEEGQETFRDALEEFRAVLGTPETKLSKAYDRIQAAYDDSKAAAETIRDRVDSVESVADKLFEEWECELRQYDDASLRRQSERQLNDTRVRYKKMLAQMHKSSSRLDPVLRIMKDQVLYLKHNLNSQALGNLSSEVRQIDANVSELIASMRESIQESKRFIDSMAR